MKPKVVAILLFVAGAFLIVAGAGTWYTVSDQLAAEQITVSDDASCQAGQTVNGPLEAFCQAEIINKHALESTGGKTYAQLDREDPLRAVAQSASFLRASLFTSVVAFGVAAFAMGVGVLMLIIGAGFSNLAKREAAAPAEAATV
ncbi:MAG: hypothetical protein MUD13_00220 [Candidatus Nanopelagicales bacterium]|jgi:hypothetical protein|nr:hypothetical protein [Candidatus Nanopelagicales bacterium]